MQGGRWPGELLQDHNPVIQIAKVSHRESIQGTSPTVDKIGPIQIMQPFAQRFPVGIGVIKLTALTQRPLIDHRQFGEPLTAGFEVLLEALGGKHWR
ncbi:hypothetical protein D3C80_1096770 [compost metagenome]